MNIKIKKNIILITLVFALGVMSACGEKGSDTVTSSETASIIYQVEVDSETESKTSDTTKNSEKDSSSAVSKTDTESTSESRLTVSAASKAASSKTTSSKANQSYSDLDSSSAASSEEPNDSEPDTEYTVSEEEIESSLSGYENEIVGEWKAQYILNNNNEEVSGEELFGKAYRQYGGTLFFNDDGSFSLTLGVDADDESTKGTYTYLGGSDIALQYSDDSTDTCKRVYVNDQDAIALPIDLFGDNFTVYFVM